MITHSYRRRFERIVMAGCLAVAASSSVWAASSTTPVFTTGAYVAGDAAPDYLTTTDTGGNGSLQVTGGNAAPIRPSDQGMVVLDWSLTSGPTAVFVMRSTGWGCFYSVNGTYVSSSVGSGGSGAPPTWESWFDNDTNNTVSIALEVNGPGDADNSIAVGGSGTLTVTLNGGSASLQYNVSLNASPGGIVGLSSGITMPGGGSSQTVPLTGVAPGTVTITASCSDASPGSATVSATVVGIDRIQWNNNGVWTDVTGTLTVPTGGSLAFQAIPKPSGASWPPGKPVWGGTSGASGTGTTTTVTFNTASASTTDFKTVTAECGNTVTANVLVVGVDRIQWNNGGTWTDVSGTLAVAASSTISFQAILKPSGASWPSGKPVWGGTSGASGTGETTTVTFGAPSSNTTDFKTVTAESGNTVTANVLVVGVDKIQWNNNGTWTDLTGGTLAVAVSSTISFKALPNPAGASWPSGKLVWGGTSGASGSGTDTTSVTFNTPSSSTTDFKTVTAECGNTVTANALVVGVISMTVSEHGNPTNTVSNPSGGTLLVAQDPISGSASIDLSASWLPSDSSVGSQVLWTVTGASPAPSSGNFGTGSSPTIQLTPSGSDRTATVSVGFDANGNGVLDSNEIAYSITVAVANVVLTVENAGRSGGRAPDGVYGGSACHFYRHDIGQYPLRLVQLDSVHLSLSTCRRNPLDGYGVVHEPCRG